MKRARLLRLFLGIAVLLLPGLGAHADELRVLSLKHRSASELMPLIRPLLGPDDLLSGTDYRLIIRTSEKNFREIERVLSQVDVARAMLRITVAQDVAETRDATRHSVTGDIRLGNRARVTLPGERETSDGAVVEKDGVRYSTQRRTQTVQQSSRQTITTLDGKPAYIRIGQSIPQVRRVLAFAHHPPVFISDVELRDVSTGFSVLPRVHGDRITLEITPRIARLSDPTTGLVDFQELSTTVDVPRGEWFDLGTTLENRSEVARAILEGADAATGERRRVRVKIE